MATAPKVPKVPKVPGASEPLPPTPTTAQNEHLPNSVDVDPKAIEAAVLTRQGWVVPAKEIGRGV